MNTYGDIRNAFFHMVRDSADAEVTFTKAQASAWANKALRDLAEKTGYADAVAVYSLAAGSETYAVGEMRDLHRVEMEDGGEYRAIYPTTRAALMQHYSNLTEVTGTPQFYYTDSTRSTTYPQYLFVGLYPVPSATMNYRFISKGFPSAVSDGDLVSEIDVPHWAAPAVLYYMLFEAYRSDTRLLDLGKSRFFRSMYDYVRDCLYSRSRGKLRNVWSESAGPDWPNFDPRMPETITGV